MKEVKYFDYQLHTTRVSSCGNYIQHFRETIIDYNENGVYESKSKYDNDSNTIHRSMLGRIQKDCYGYYNVYYLGDDFSSRSDGRTFVNMILTKIMTKRRVELNEHNKSSKIITDKLENQIEALQKIIKENNDNDNI